MIRVFDDALPAPLCARVVAAVETEPASAAHASLALADLGAELEHELLADYVIPLLWDALGDAPNLDPSRTALLPDLARVLRHAPHPHDSCFEPVRWSAGEGYCLLACLNEPSEAVFRVFAAEGQRVAHQTGRVIVFPATGPYTLQTGRETLYTLAAFAETVAAPQLRDLDPGLSEDELRCLALLGPGREPPQIHPWPSPPVRLGGSLELRSAGD